MSYKTKLQTNNDNLEGNNIDLQSILNTINELPAAGSGTEDLDAEITEQEGLIEQIEAALVGKAAGGGSEISMITTTILDEEVGDAFNDFTQTLTINELIGAKYFIVHGNPLKATEIANAYYVDNANCITYLLYLNGLIYVNFLLRDGNGCATETEILDNTGFSFDEVTGTITFLGNFCFAKVTTDTSTTGIAYTVYRIG